MKLFTGIEFDAYRDRAAETMLTGATLGPEHAVFRRWGLIIIATRNHGWDHVSVSHKDRCPTWDEMERVKRWLFLPDETAMQLHVPPSDHVNVATTCLHLWRPQNVEIPRPPAHLVL